MERWQKINVASNDEARELLRLCCGAPEWIDRMLAARPFASRQEAVDKGRDVWFGLSADQWRRAFTHHPRIGDLQSLTKTFGASAPLSQTEQSGVRTASAEVLQRLLEANRAYEARFGYTFIVCATGKSAEEMLAMLSTRLLNRPEDELRVAADEHAKICALRLAGAS